MTEAEYAKTLEELDRQLNDPDVPMDPARVWELLADLGERASRSIQSPAHQMRANSDARKVRQAETIREMDDQQVALCDTHMDANRRPVKMNTHLRPFSPTCQRLEGP